MATTDAAQQALRTALPCDFILRIAHEDAQRAYGDLSPYRITLALKEDGWHVDYELTDPLVAGGGAHYVIDPSSGRIVSKRYEQ
jgi:hypothetical protein